MRFTQKLTVTILVLLCAALSVGGAFSIQQNFSHALQVAQQQKTEMHMRECYQLETAFAHGEGLEPTAIYAMTEKYAREQKAAMGEGVTQFSLFSKDGMSVYSNISSGIPFALQRETAEQGRGLLRYYQSQNEIYMMTATALRGWDYTLVSTYSVTDIFAERDRQVQQYAVLQLTVLALAGMAALFVSMLLTRPLRKLETASKQIADGAYDSRVNVRSHDEIGQLAQSFNVMAQAVESHMQVLEEESQRQKRFVGAFTHELKTPMTAILGYADMLRRGEQPPQKRQMAANYIYHESMRLEHLSKSLLQLLGLEQEEISLVPVSVNAVFNDVLRSMDKLRDQIEISCPEQACVLADRTLLGDLLHNLVLNAFHAQPKDGKVALSCSPCQEGWSIAVEDKGSGIPQKELDKLCEPFYRVDKSRAREHGGNGLGLSLCAQIAQLHGSTLKIESEVDVGTKVSIRLKEGKA